MRCNNMGCQHATSVVDDYEFLLTRFYAILLFNNTDRSEMCSSQQFTTAEANVNIPPGDFAPHFTQKSPTSKPLIQCVASSNIQLYCPNVASPEATIRWLRNNGTISLDPLRVRIVRIKGPATLANIHHALT